MKKNRSIFLLFVLIIIFIIVVQIINYNLIDKEKTDLWKTKRDLRDVSTFQKRLLNGYLGAFFRFKYFGNLNWLIIPIIIYFLITIKKRDPWEKALLFIYIIVSLIIVFKGCLNWRYQMTLFPITISIILLYTWKLINDRNDLFKLFFFIFFAVLSIYNIYHYFKAYKVFWDLRVTQKEDYFPDKILDFLSYNVNSDSLVLVCNNPEFYYYTDKKGIDYLDHRVRNLLKKQGDRKECFDILKKNKIKYIYTNWAFESIYRNRLIGEILSLDCKKIFLQRSKTLYEVRKNIIEKEFYSKDFIEYRVWYERKKNARKTSPSLKIQGIRGKFNFKYSKSKDGNILSINNVKQNKEGKRILQFGYSLNLDDFCLKNQRGIYAYFVVCVKISENSVNRDNYIFIQDFNENWDRKKIYFSTSCWRTYLIKKKIRKSSLKVGIGIKFSPGSVEDKIKIKEIKIYLSQVEL